MNREELIKRYDFKIIGLEKERRGCKTEALKEWYSGRLIEARDALYHFKNMDKIDMQKENKQALKEVINAVEAGIKDFYEKRTDI